MSALPHRLRRVRKPFSPGLYDEERTQIERDAGTLPLGVYIRGKLLDGSEHKRPVRRSHRPTVDHTALARLLGTSGNRNCSAAFWRYLWLHSPACYLSMTN